MMRIKHPLVHSANYEYKNKGENNMKNKIMLICLKDSKKGNFTKGKVYVGVNFGDNNYRLIGNDNKSHLMKKERFILIKGE